MINDIFLNVHETTNRKTFYKCCSPVTLDKKLAVEEKILEF